MSWGALPWWVYSLEYEHELAKKSCAFEDEWFSGTARETPEHVFYMSKSNFKSWEYGGYNYQYTEDEIEAMINERKNKNNNENVL